MRGTTSCITQALSLFIVNAPTATFAAVCPGPVTLEGIDVSAYEGTIDWSSVAETKSFAFIHVGDGLDATDPKFANNYAEAKAAGMVRGAYQYFRASEDAAAQANRLLEMIDLPLQAGDLPPVLDVEITDGQQPGVIAAGINEWVSTIRNKTRTSPIVYTSATFWNNDIQTSGPDNAQLWVANWNVSCPTIPNGWSS